MSLQNAFARFMQRSIQFFLLLLVGWFLPEIIFYFIHFNEADRFEIKSFIVALFMGIFMLNLLSAIFKKRKVRSILKLIFSKN